MHSRLFKRFAFVASLALLLPAVSLAQSKNQPEMLSGKVSSIVIKGKAVTLKIETDSGETYDVLITPKVNFTVTAKGEADLLKKLGKEPVMVAGERTVWNEATKVYVAGTLTVYHKVKMPGKRMDNMGGVDFCAPLVSATEKEVMLGGDVNGKVVPEADTFAYSVVSNDGTLATEGAKAELEGIKRGKNFVTSKLAVTLDKELTAEDISTKKGSKPKPTKTEKTGDKPADKTSDKTNPKTAAKGSDKPLVAADPFKDVKGDKAPKANLNAADPFKGTVKGESKELKPATTTDPFKDAAKGTPPAAPKKS